MLFILSDWFSSIHHKLNIFLNYWRIFVISIAEQILHLGNQFKRYINASLST